jgi:hypothetical protein
MKKLSATGEYSNHIMALPKTNAVESGTFDTNSAQYYQIKMYFRALAAQLSLCFLQIK